MKLNDTDFSLQDRERVERELDSNEELLLACKPALSLWKPGYAYRMFFAAVSNGFLFGSLGMLFINHHITLEKIIEKPAIQLLFLGMLPFYLIGIGFIVSPWWERENDRQTVYVLTNRRALMLRPSTFRRQPTCRQFPLSFDMIKEVKEHRNGRGDIILEYDEHHGKNGVSLMPVGFLFVENVRSWESCIRRHLPAAPPSATIEKGSDDSSQRPALGYVLLVIVTLLFSLIYLVWRFCLAESEPHTKSNDICVLFAVCISINSVRIVWRWAREVLAFRKKSDNGTMQSRQNRNEM